eukprot:m.527317 g.527317  ORF g.527317 m.527317 type:complete len:91 (+) comp57559_c0_seq11:89-361(+)
MVITIFRTDWNDQSRQAIERCDFEEEEDVPLLKVDDENQVAAVPPPTAQSLNEGPCCLLASSYFSFDLSPSLQIPTSPCSLCRRRPTFRE